MPKNVRQDVSNYTPLDTFLLWYCKYYFLLGRFLVYLQKYNGCKKARRYHLLKTDPTIPIFFVNITYFRCISTRDKFSTGKISVFIPRFWLSGKSRLQIFLGLRSCILIAHCSIPPQSVPNINRTVSSTRMKTESAPARIFAAISSSMERLPLWIHQTA